MLKEEQWVSNITGNHTNGWVENSSIEITPKKGNQKTFIKPKPEISPIPKQAIVKTNTSDGARSFDWTSVYDNYSGAVSSAATILAGYASVANDTKRHYAHKLSKVTNLKSGKIFQGTKAFAKSAGKVVSKLGVVGNVASGGIIVYEGFSGEWDAHTIVNGSLLVATGAALYFGAPAVLTGVAVYGVVDYAFDISEEIDANFGRKSGLYGP